MGRPTKEKMTKRGNPLDDVPRRIYRSTIKRMDRYLTGRAKPAKTSRNLIKQNFNEFLIEIMDVYEASKAGKNV